MVLDRGAGADCHLCGLLPLVQEGAVDQALIEVGWLAGYDRLFKKKNWDETPGVQIFFFILSYLQIAFGLKLVGLNRGLHMLAELLTI